MKTMWKKIIGGILLVIICFVIYLKIPTYDSGIPDSFFDTKYSDRDTLSESNGVLLIRGYAEFLSDNNQKYDFFHRKYQCLKSNNFSNLNFERIECQKYKEYLEVGEIGNLKDFRILMLKQKTLYKDVKNMDFIKYDRNIYISSSLVNMQRAIQSYIYELYSLQDNDKATEYLVQLLDNNFYILGAADLDLSGLLLYRSLLNKNITFIEGLEKENLLIDSDKAKLWVTLNENVLDKDIMKVSLKSEYGYFVRNFYPLYMDTLSKQYNTFFDKIWLFLFFNGHDTKEKLKEIYKESLEGNGKTIDIPKPHKIFDIKNYIGKYHLQGVTNVYESQYKIHQELLDRINILKSNLK